VIQIDSASYTVIGDTPDAQFTNAIDFYDENVRKIFVRNSILLHRDYFDVPAEGLYVTLTSILQVTFSDFARRNLLFLNLGNRAWTQTLKGKSWGNFGLGERGQRFLHALDGIHGQPRFAPEKQGEPDDSKQECLMEKEVYVMPFVCTDPYVENGIPPGTLIPVECPEGQSGIKYAYCGEFGWDESKGFENCGAPARLQTSNNDFLSCGQKTQCSAEPVSLTSNYDVTSGYAVCCDSPSQCSIDTNMHASCVGTTYSFPKQFSWLETHVYGIMLVILSITASILLFMIYQRRALARKGLEQIQLDRCLLIDHASELDDLIIGSRDDRYINPHAITTE